jgi:hypothetical protein
VLCGEGVFIHTHTQGKHGKVRRQRARKQSVKRDLLKCQKRPTKVSKETYYSVKRRGKHGKVRRQRARKQSLREREREKFIDKQIDD